MWLSDRAGCVQGPWVQPLALKKNHVLDAQEILSLDALVDSSQEERHFLQSHINIIQTEAAKACATTPYERK